MPKHNIKVDLTDTFHGFDVIDRIRTQLRANGVSSEEITEFTEEALFGRDYEHLLSTCTAWVEVAHA